MALAILILAKVLEAQHFIDIYESICMIKSSIWLGIPQFGVQVALGQVDFLDIELASNIYLDYNL